LHMSAYVIIAIAKNLV